jgi:hypothetical protein
MPMILEAEALPGKFAAPTNGTHVERYGDDCGNF